MTLGYTSPLYLLPFDHRHSYLAEMFHFTAPLTPEQHTAVVATKQLIYDGFQAALDGRVAQNLRAELLVHEDPGAILRDAAVEGGPEAVVDQLLARDDGGVLRGRQGRGKVKHLRDVRVPVVEWQQVKRSGVAEGHGGSPVRDAR